MTARRHLLAPLAVACALAGCGGSDTKTVTQTVGGPTATATATAPTGTATATAPTATATAPSTRPARTSPAPSAPPAASRTPSCGSVAGNFVRNIRATGTDCATARGVARAWLTQVQHGRNPATPIAVAGYACRASFHGQAAAGACDRGRARITFAAQP